MQGVQDGSLVGELRSHMLGGAVKKNFFFNFLKYFSQQTSLPCAWHYGVRCLGYKDQKELVTVLKG